MGVAQLAWDALLLRPEAFRAVIGRPDVTLVVLVAGVSQLLGQSVILFLNRVRPLRFVLAVLLAGLTLAVEIAVWTAGLWTTAVLAGADIGIAGMFAVVALGHAPYLFAFLILMPYFGRPIQRLLEVWTLVAITVGLVATTRLPLPVVLLAVALGFAFRVGVTIAVGRWFHGLDRWLWRTVTGARVRMRAEDAVSVMRQLAAQDSQGLFRR